MIKKIESHLKKEWDMTPIYHNELTEKENDFYPVLLENVNDVIVPYDRFYNDNSLSHLYKVQIFLTRILRLE